VFFCCARQTDGAFLRAIRRPSREKPGPARVTKKIIGVGFEIRRKIFSKKKLRKNSLRTSESLPDLRCVNAAKSF
jgi:hypothetical protein